jgi:hypothetical protein
VQSGKGFVTDETQKYNWRETWPGETGLDGKPHQDYCGWDGETLFGRILLEPDGSSKGQWRHATWVKTVVHPQGGWAKTAREASHIVEEHYEQLKAAN